MNVNANQSDVFDVLETIKMIEDFSKNDKFLSGEIVTTNASGAFLFSTRCDNAKANYIDRFELVIIICQNGPMVFIAAADGRVGWTHINWLKSL